MVELIRDALTGPVLSVGTPEMPEPGAPSGRDRHQAPEEAAAEVQCLAAKAVADKPGQRRPGGVDPHERRADQALLSLVEAELALEDGEDGEDGLAVGVVEEADAPEHADDEPFVIWTRRVSGEMEIHGPL